MRTIVGRHFDHEKIRKWFPKLAIYSVCSELSVKNKVVMNLQWIIPGRISEKKRRNIVCGIQDRFCDLYDSVYKEFFRRESSNG